MFKINDKQYIENGKFYHRVLSSWFTPVSVYSVPYIRYASFTARECREISTDDMMRPRKPGRKAVIESSHMFKSYPE